MATHKKRDVRSTSDKGAIIPNFTASLYLSVFQPWLIVVHGDEVFIPPFFQVERNIWSCSATDNPHWICLFSALSLSSCGDLLWGLIQSYLLSFKVILTVAHQQERYQSCDRTYSFVGSGHAGRGRGSSGFILSVGFGVKDFRSDMATSGCTVRCSWHQPKLTEICLSQLWCFVL